MLKEIVNFIESKSLGPPWEIGVNMFSGWLPLKDEDGNDIPVRSVAILETTPGGMVPELPDRCDKMIQVWNRAESYFVARDDAVEIFRELHGVIDGTLLTPVAESGYFAMVVEAIGCPAPIANPDEKGHFIFSTNYLWRIKQPP